jgi:O-antigen/teichoic acid export membrane protein
VSADGPGLETQVAKGVAWAASAQAVIAIADLLSQLIVVAVWVSADDYGLAFAAIPFYAALDNIADLGVSSALIQHDDHTPERVSTVFWINVLISGALFVALLGIGPLYGFWVKQPIVGTLLTAYGLKLLIQNVYSIPFAMLRKELRYSEIAKARIFAHLSESVARIVFAYLGFTVWCWTFAALTRALVFGIAAQIAYPFLPKLVFKPRDVMPYIKFGARTAASNVLYQVYTSMDSPIILRFFGPFANGIYGLADSIVLEPVKTIANVVIDVAYPTFAKLRSDRRALVAQFIRFTRLNVIAVLPFAVLILLVIPEFLRLFYLGKKWGPDDIDWAADCARILCVMGFFRALGYLGPPLLDGIGRPGLTLRYMMIATVAVPGSFLLGAITLGDRMSFLSVAVAWAIGYPIAFAVLAYLVIHAIKLPVREYLRASWGIVASCAVGCGVGFAVDRLLINAGDWLRLIAIGGSALATIGVLFVYWQKLTPRSIAASLRD